MPTLVESDELHPAEIRRTNKETVTVVEQRMHMEINDPCSCYMVFQTFSINGPFRKALAEETLLILEEGKFVESWDVKITFQDPSSPVVYTGGYSSPSADCWVDIAEALERSCDNSFVLHEDDDLPHLGLLHQ